MRINTKYMFFILALSMMLPGFSVAAEEQVYGWHMMTEQERNEYHIKMQSMHTEQEREQFRMEHHKLMQERAKERGIKLPEYQDHMRQDMPHGSGMGPGMGSGSKGR